MPLPLLSLPEAVVGAEVGEIDGVFGLALVVGTSNVGVEEEGVLAGLV